MLVYLRVVPGFSVAVEEVRRPELRSHPLIIGGLPHQRGVVREVNGPAQYAGVRPGMTLAQAQQHCPHGVFLLPDPAHYECVWEEICAVLRRSLPLVEPLEIGQAVCDLAGCERFWRDERSAGRAIRRQIARATGLAPALGIAANRLVAQLASLFAEEDGVRLVESGREREFLADLPLTSLPGVDPNLALTFRVLGLTTISQFAALPLSAVKGRFGAAGEQLHRYARGIDPRPVLPPAEKASIVARHDCDDGSIEEALAGLQTLAGTCAAELQARRAAGTLVGVTLIWGEGTNRILPFRRPDATRAGGESPALPPPDVPPSPRPADPQRHAFPISYRVHSSRLPHPLPQPADPSPDETAAVVPAVRGDGAASVPLPVVGESMEGRLQELTAMVRTPIATAPPLLERARQLFLQCWARPPAAEEGIASRLLAIELRIGEFTAPSQLSLSDFDRLDVGGTLQGLSAERRQALARHDEAFAARYGTTAFQHVTAVDAANVLTERRFRWEEGLPWKDGARRKLS